jgi:hypothetical protein
MSGIQWQKSSYSADAEGNACVELARVSDSVILLRESDDPQVVIATSPAVLRALTQGIKTGEFDSLAG